MKDFPYKLRVRNLMGLKFNGRSYAMNACLDIRSEHELLNALYLFKNSVAIHDVDTGEEVVRKEAIEVAKGLLEEAVSAKKSGKKPKKKVKKPKVEKLEEDSTPEL